MCLRDLQLVSQVSCQTAGLETTGLVYLDQTLRPTSSHPHIHHPSTPFPSHIYFAHALSHHPLARTHATKNACCPSWYIAHVASASSRLASIASTPYSRQQQRQAFNALATSIHSHPPLQPSQPSFASMHFPNALLGSANSTAEQPLLFPPQQHDALKPQPQTWQASSPVQILTAPTRKRKASNELADGGQGWSTDMQGGTLAERRKVSPTSLSRIQVCMPTNSPSIHSALAPALHARQHARVRPIHASPRRRQQADARRP